MIFLLLLSIVSCLPFGRERRDDLSPGSAVSYSRSGPECDGMTRNEVGVDAGMSDLL